MVNKGLIFIPDISGFTRFVNQTEIEHSRVIIQELLEILINANQIGLEISEIEGDAILFYKYGNAPSLEEIYHQVEKMFCEFHRHLVAYEQRRICQCLACKSANDLTLKVITHYGEFTGYNVKHFSKLIGKDIILAHQLLKNDIDHHEYWLVTDELAQNESRETLPTWINWNSSAKETDNGKVPFLYTYLAPLKTCIAPEPVSQLEISDKVKIFTVSTEYDADINTVFFTALDFTTRDHWQAGVKETDLISHTVPQIGTEHRCVFASGSANLVSSSFSYSPEKITYSETDKKKQHAGYFTFERLGENRSRATYDFYLKNNFAFVTVFRLFLKKKYEKLMHQSLANLAEVVKQAPASLEV